MITQTTKVKNGSIVLPANLRSSWRRADVFIFPSDDTLIIKKIQPSLEITKLLLSRAYFVISYLRLTEIKEDLSDNYILAAALACGCSFIVSGDKHLLKLKQFQNIPILTPKIFIQRFLK